MAKIEKMPRLSDTMTEGVVSKWHKKVGDKVKSGDLLAEIETDKATMEYESITEGVLLYIGVAEGQTAPVDTILAIFGAEGEDYKPLLDEFTAQAKATEKVEDPAGTPTAPPVEAPAPKVEVATPAPQPVKTVVQAPAPQPNSNGRIIASPLAKRLAEEKGINIAAIAGSGEGGRIIKRDVDNYQGNGLRSLAPPVEAYTEEPVSQMRKTIARRLSESMYSAPHFYLTMDIDMGQATLVREGINKAIAPLKVSFNDLVIKAAAVALKDNPKVNAAWLGDKIRYNQHVHVGMAVAVDDGLLVPVIRFADSKPLTQISAEAKDFAGRAKDKKLQPSDWEGNTFTVSNLGMFGIEEFTAIINPPDACILAIGAIKEVPVVKNGAVVPGQVMRVTLSADHRAVDGATGAKFLVSLKNYLENPVLLLGRSEI